MKKYIATERAKYWPVSKELMAQYKDGSHTYGSKDGTLIWEKNGQWHRDGDLPAVIYPDGQLEWYQNGLVHRDGDKPAVIYPNGQLEWRQNERLHRLCGPAVIYSNGKLGWLINGKNITQEVCAWLADTKWRGTLEQIAEFQLRFC
jgi:hypothetical protein